MKRLRLRLLVLLVPLVAFGRAAETRLVLVREGCLQGFIAGSDRVPGHGRASEKVHGHEGGAHRQGTAREPPFAPQFSDALPRVRTRTRLASPQPINE